METIKLNLPKNWYDENDHIFKKTSFELKEGISVLCGCNGAGKSTFLDILKHKLNNEDIPYVFFDNLKDGHTTGLSEMLFNNDMNSIALSLSSSEGQNIKLNFSRFLKKFITMTKNMKDDTSFLLLDACDSGLSIDNVIELKTVLHLLLHDIHKLDKKCFIVIACNEYEMTCGEACIDVMYPRYITIKTYDRFKKIVIRSREFLNERYKQFSGKDEYND